MAAIGETAVRQARISSPATFGSPERQAQSETYPGVVELEDEVGGGAPGQKVYAAAGIDGNCQTLSAAQVAPHASASRRHTASA